MKKILLVDDEAHVLRVIKLNLDRHGYEVDTAMHGDVALRMLQETGFDVLLVDADMPGMTGCQLCEAMHREIKTRPPITFIVTQQVDTRLEEWVTKFPDTEFLEQPISLRWLVARLGELFGDYTTNDLTGSFSGAGRLSLEYARTSGDVNDS